MFMVAGTTRKSELSRAFPNANSAACYGVRKSKSLLYLAFAIAKLAYTSVGLLLAPASTKNLCSTREQAPRAIQCQCAAMVERLLQACCSHISHACIMQRLVLSACPPQAHSGRAALQRPPSGHGQHRRSRVRVPLLHHCMN